MNVREIRPVAAVPGLPLQGLEVLPGVVPGAVVADLVGVGQILPLLQGKALRQPVLQDIVDALVAAQGLGDGEGYVVADGGEVQLLEHRPAQGAHRRLGPEAPDKQGVPDGGGAGAQQEDRRQQQGRPLPPEAPGLEGPGPPWQGGEYVLCQTLPHSLRGGAAVHRVIIRVHVSTHSFRRASRPRFSLIFTVGTVTPSSRAIS